MLRYNTLKTRTGKHASCHTSLHSILAKGRRNLFIYFVNEALRVVVMYANISASDSSKHTASATITADCKNVIYINN
jgi:hypothetical protein